MEQPSVTLRHDTAYLLAGFMLILTAINLTLTYVMPADLESRQISLVVAVPMILCCVACIYWGASTETLNENGIYIKRPFYSKRYLWSDVIKVSIEVMPSRGGKTPEFSLRIQKRRFPLAIAYTKRSMACITCYYGQPDQDKWGKPPVLM